MVNLNFDSLGIDVPFYYEQEFTVPLKGIL